MPSLQQSFDELRQRLRHGGGLNRASDDPVVYLIFPPQEMLEVKRRLRKWTAQLKLDGWTVHQFSMAEAVYDIFQKHPLRDLWLESDRDDPFDFDAINKTLADALMANNTLQSRLEQKLRTLEPDKKDLLLITDLEALHPYLRVGSLEQRLQGKFTVPTVIFYPGTRAGQTTLKFLGIYPEDGNYRSTHIGG